MSASKPAVYYGPIELTGRIYFLDRPSDEEQAARVQQMMALDLDCDIPFSNGQRLKRLVVEFPDKNKDGKVTFYAEPDAKPILDSKLEPAALKVGALGIRTWASLVPNDFLEPKPGPTTLEGEKVEEPAHESDQTGHERAPDHPAPLGHGVQRE